MASDPPTTAVPPPRYHSPVDDPSSVYYLHPSEGSGLVLVSQPLSGDNYNSWSRAFLVAITIKNKLGFLDGTVSLPENPSPILQNAWIRNNNLVFSWIYNSLSKEIQASILYTTSAKSAWDELRTRFMQSNGPRQFQLRRELSNLTLNDLSVTQYFTKMKTIWDELSQFRPSCVCSQCSCGGVLRLCSYFETEFVLSFLMGLNDSLNNTRSQILLLDPLPSIHRVFAMMVQEEHQRSLNSLASAPGNMLTLATRFENPNARFDPSNQAKKSSFMPGNQFKRKDRPMCSHCGLLGHTIDQCFKIHGYPPGYKPRPRNPRSSNANQATIASDNDNNSTTLGNILQNLSTTQCQDLVNYFSHQLQSQNATNQVSISEPNT